MQSIANIVVLSCASKQTGWFETQMMGETLEFRVTELLKPVVIGFIIVLLMFWPGAGGANQPHHGLMWNKTGLPAVFPLQVKSAVGQNYVVTLIDVETKNPALAAFIEGGRFFKVLVPPGNYHVQFAAGTDWQDGVAPFGTDETTYFALQEPLNFAVLNAGTKGGHLIDLSDLTSGIAVKNQFICQRVVISAFPRPQAPFDEAGFATRLTQEGEVVSTPNRFSKDRLAAGADRPVIPTDFAPYFSDPRFDVRNVPC